MFKRAGRNGYTALAALALLCGADSHPQAYGHSWTEGNPRADDNPTQLPEKTAVGESRQMLLPDGTHIDMNTDTVLRKRGSHVALQKGEARFRSAVRSHSVLDVSAGQVQARSVSSDFAIRLVDPDRVRVLVIDGHVDLGAHGAQRSLLSLTSGEWASFENNTMISRGRLSPVALRHVVAWTDGWLWFADTPLSEAIAEFNRYHPQQLVLADPSLQRLQIGGRFRVADLPGFLAALQRIFHVRSSVPLFADTSTPTIYLRRRCERAQQQCN